MGSSRSHALSAGAGTGTGTGSVFRDGGYILTDEHVVSAAVDRGADVASTTPSWARTSRPISPSSLRTTRPTTARSSPTTTPGRSRSADRAGIAPRDQITEIDLDPASSAEQLVLASLRHEAGDAVEVTYHRGDTTHTTEVVLAAPRAPVAGAGEA